MLNLDYEKFKKWANDITNAEIHNKQEIPYEMYDENGYVVIDNTLQAYHILQTNPDAKLRSDNEQIQKRIDLYNESKNPNLMLFAAPTIKEFEKEFHDKNKKDNGWCKEMEERDCSFGFKIK